MDYEGSRLREHDAGKLAGDLADDGKVNAKLAALPCNSIEHLVVCQVCIPDIAMCLVKNEIDGCRGTSSRI